MSGSQRLRHSVLRFSNLQLAAIDGQAPSPQDALSKVQSYDKISQSFHVETEIKNSKGTAAVKRSNSPYVCLLL